MEHKQIKDNITILQKELQDRTRITPAEIGDQQLSGGEKVSIQQEVDEIIKSIEREETGLVSVAIVGRSGVGKSSVVNSLVGKDVAEIIDYDRVMVVEQYREAPWIIVDVQSIMGREIIESLVCKESQKAHIHIFMVEGEPFDVETKLFDFVCNYFPDIPRVVFVNKYDQLQHMTKHDRDMVIQHTKVKMRKYVKEDEDIIFGSAQLKDDENDEMVRQKLPWLEKWLYSNANILHN